MLRLFMEVKAMTISREIPMVSMEVSGLEHHEFWWIFLPCLITGGYITIYKLLSYDTLKQINVDTNIQFTLLTVSYRNGHHRF